jgi:LPS sulfotransferase NodH
MPYPLRQKVLLALQILRRGEIPRAAHREVPSISLDEVAEAKTFFPLDKYFIFGHARSGTTMLTRLIRQHPEVHCNYQAHFFTRPPLLESLVADAQVGEWLARGSNRWNHGRDLSPVVLRAAADYILEREARLEGKRIVGDKSPSSLMDGEAVRLMHKVYPDGSLIYIVRDGRDTAVSHRFQTFIEFPERLSKEDQRIRLQFARDPQPFLSGEQSIFTEAGITRAAQGWVRNVTQTDQQGRSRFSERYLSLRYEDLLQQPWEQMCRVWDFLGASPAGEDLHQALVAEMALNPDAEWQQQKAQDIAQALQKGKQGTWLELFTARDRQIFRQVADKTLIAWGYQATP